MTQWPAVKIHCGAMIGAAAEAALILHRGIEPHLPGIFALGRLGAGDDHLVIVGGERAAARDAESDEEDCDKRITP